MDLAPPIRWPTGPPPPVYSPIPIVSPYAVTPYLDGSPIYRTSSSSSAVSSPPPSFPSPQPASLSEPTSPAVSSSSSASASETSSSAEASGSQPPSFAATQELYWNATLTLNETMSCNSSRLSVTHSCCNGLFVTSSAPGAQLGGQCRLPRSADGMRNWERCVRGTGVDYAKCTAFNRLKEDWEGTLRGRLSWKGKLKEGKEGEGEEVCVDLGGEVVQDCCKEVDGELGQKHDRRWERRQDEGGDDAGGGEGNGGEGKEGEEKEGRKPPPPPPPPRACKIPKSKRGDWDQCIERHDTYSVCTDNPRISSALRARASLALCLLSVAVATLA